MTLSFPANTEIIKIRKEIFDKIQSVIPEDLGDSDWDYKIVAEKRNKKTVLVFAPVKEKFAFISKTLQKLKFEVEAIEPISVAKMRHSDPIIGLALKKDLKGKDEEILNFALNTPKISEISKENNDQGSNLIPKQEQRKKIFLKYLLIGLFIAILFILGLLYWQSARLSRPSNQSNLKSATPFLKKTVFTITPQLEKKIDLSDLKINVLNGSGNAGEAANVAEILEEDGFKNIETGNATNSAFIDTVLQVKRSKNNDELVNRISNLLNEYSVTWQNPLTASNEYDLLIIVGKKL